MCIFENKWLKISSVITIGAWLLFATQTYAGGDESKLRTPNMGYALDIDLKLDEPPELGQVASADITVKSNYQVMKHVQIELLLPQGIQSIRAPQKTSTTLLLKESPLNTDFQFITQQPGQYKITAKVTAQTESGEYKDRFEYLFFTVSETNAKNQMGWDKSVETGPDDTWSFSEKPDLSIDSQGFVTVQSADALLNHTTRKIPAGQYFTENKATDNLQGASVTINGRYRYRNRENTANIGFNHTLMRLINSSTGDHLAWTYSDDNGYFTFPAVTNPGSDGMRVRVYAVRYLNGQGYGVCDYATCIDNAASDSGTYDQFYYRQTAEFVIGDGNQNIGTYTSGYSLSNSLRALWIHQDMGLAYDHLIQNTSIRGPFTAEWSGDSTHGNHYHRDGNMHFKSDVGDGTNHTVLHELGHNVMFNAGTFPAGSDCPSPHFINRISGTQCAWTEGWASAFLLLVNNDPIKCSPPSTTNCTLFETSPSYDNCGTSWDCGPDSDQVEGHVTGALWDIYDTIQDDFDIQAYGMNEIYNILETDTNDSFVSWWTSWLNDGNSDLALNSLYQNDIVYGDDYDVRVYNPNLDNQAPNVNQDITLNAYIRNLGDVSSIATNIGFYLSTNSTISTADTELATYFGGVLDKNIIRQVGETFSLDTPGSYWIGACFKDFYGFDGNFSNNCTTGLSVNVIDSDLIFESGFE